MVPVTTETTVLHLWLCLTGPILTFGSFPEPFSCSVQLRSKRVHLQPLMMIPEPFGLNQQSQKLFVQQTSPSSFEAVTVETRRPSVRLPVQFLLSSAAGGWL